MSEIKWKKQPQETKGTYMFSGKFLCTSGVINLLSELEIKSIYLEVQDMVKEQNGIDYLVVYIHKETNQKLFFIDQLNREMIESGGFDLEHNHATLMLAKEY